MKSIHSHLQKNVNGANRSRSRFMTGLGRQQTIKAHITGRGSLQAENLSGNRQRSRQVKSDQWEQEQGRTYRTYRTGFSGPGQKLRKTRLRQGRMGQ